MSKRLLCITAGIALSLSASATYVAAQDRPTTTTTTTQTTKTVQNPDGTYTVIQYPADKEVTVDLMPGTLIPGAKGWAKVIRKGDATNINLDLSGITGDVNNYNVYAVDPSGKFTLLGPVAVTNGTATQTFTTPMDKFMLVLSPESNLTAMADNTPILFRSGVPQGFAVLPMGSSGERDGAAVGERVSAATTSGTTPAYTAPLLGIPNWRRGTDTEMKIRFAGEMTGTRANVSIEPRKDGATTIRMRFHELKEAPGGKRYVLWAVSADNKYHRLGQVVNTGQRNEAEIRTETGLPDFGLFITTEDVNDPPPAGTIIGTVIRGQ
ncbi:MAG TPA: hypothetical protein VK363_17075 [Pyrinomonadaceae bacterium]|nr:hypothetical protein [Pyrinomonadaceae bacterium]